jgi:Protein of unknown function (DUF4238)
VSDRQNHHYVPQFYFRHFTFGERRINLLLKGDGRLVRGASIKHQCARHNFYGSDEIESLFCTLEGRHASAIRSVINAVWDDNAPRLNEEQLGWLFEAVVSQRGRTAIEIEKHARPTESILIEVFKSYLALAPNIKNRAKMIRAVEDGHVRIPNPPLRATLLATQAAMESVPLVTDLGPYVLCNHTDFPFIFGDAPVVLINTYCQNITSLGVLGLQTPGLQIFMPLDTSTMLMLIDEDAYDGYPRMSRTIEISDRSDISQLNALQLHHSCDTVYFADWNDADHVGELWRAHKPTIVRPHMVSKVRNDILIDGVLSEQPIHHTFEPQLNIRLRLSFVPCTPISEGE